MLTRISDAMLTPFPSDIIPKLSTGVDCCVLPPSEPDTLICSANFEGM